MRIGGLCAGYGGLELALQGVMQTNLVWVADPDPGAAKVLARRFPLTVNLGDITTVDWAQVEPVDVVTAGPPCQPVSVAGRKRGDADERWIWPDVVAAIRVLRPRLAIFENPTGIFADRWFGGVLRLLAEARFDADWTCLRASSVGAPHRRERVFIVAAWPAADTNGQSRGERGFAAPGQTLSRGTLNPVAGRRGTAADTVGEPLRHQPVALTGSECAAVAGHHGDEWSAYEPAIRRWERALGRPAPRPTEPRGGHRLSPRFTEWMMGLPDGWVTAVPGITRNQQLTLLGNGVVPQQAEAALRQLLTSREAAA